MNAALNWNSTNLVILAQGQQRVVLSARCRDSGYQGDRLKA